ncbi:MAG: hypothetical protein HDR50_03775 [Desulfovibrio sp.]|uniref:hypothetical protein n=1 Tax=Desulfovibrio sp. TaxID=885 RepID=UPI001A769628|nr:hypothetical protein [Desulfovibrio sp.]MBD5416776.1 hypothetical protein [Desulfovibrio sp.]
MEGTNYKGLVKKYFLLVLPTCLIVILIFIIVLYIVDPLQIFHRAKDENRPLDDNMRAQAAGILNTFDIDSIILGSSMLANTSASEASAKLGGKFFNISFNCADYIERSVILNKALRKKIKNVIYSLDNIYINNIQDNKNLQKYLYDENILNDFKYYATLKNILRLFRIDDWLIKDDHDRPCAWFNRPDIKSHFGGIENWVAHKDDSSIRDFIHHLPSTAEVFNTVSRHESRDQAREKLAKDYIEKNILEVIWNHPNTNFYFIFPPYQRSIYANMRRFAPKDFFLHQEIIRYMVEKTEGNKNIHIYGFEDQDFLDDIANYTDPVHHHQKFNSMFLDAIAGGHHELTPENVEGYLKRCEQKAWDYDIPALNDEVQRLLGAAVKKGDG